MADTASRATADHDNHAREFVYVAGAEKALELAKRTSGVVSMKNDWKVVFS